MSAARRALVACAAGLALAAAACATPGGDGPLAIETDWDPTTRFGALTTWDWQPAAPGSGDVGPTVTPVTDAQVRAAVAAELQSRGYPRAPHAPDFWVRPVATVEDVVAAEAQFFYDQTPPWMRDALRDTHAIAGRRGVLVIDVVDPATRLPVWRGVVSGAVDPRATPEARTRRLRDATRRLLERFPPGA